MTISGGRNDTVMDNTFSNNGAWGILFVPYPDSGTPSIGQTCAGNGGHALAGFGCMLDPRATRSSATRSRTTASSATRRTATTASSCQRPPAELLLEQRRPGRQRAAESRENPTDVRPAHHRREHRRPAPGAGAVRHRQRDLPGRREVSPNHRRRNTPTAEDPRLDAEPMLRRTHERVVPERSPCIGPSSFERACLGIVVDAEAPWRRGDPAATQPRSKVRHLGGARLQSGFVLLGQGIST